jgi:hypothetical protein
MSLQGFKDSFFLRLHGAADALSQLANVLFMPRIKDTTPNESISGRSYRDGFPRLRFLIDQFFYRLFDEVGHCEKSFKNDVRRAKIEYLKYGQVLEKDDAP